MSSPNPASSPAFRLYKGNNPFEGELCFGNFLNTCLATGKPLPPAWEDMALELNELILASPLQTPIRLYRAMPDCYVNPHVRGKELYYPAFMSTSAEETAVYRHFSSPLRDVPAALLRINCAAGVPALNMELDASFGQMEQELLLPSGSCFRIDDMQQIDDRASMAELMTGLYAKNYSALKVYELTYLRSEA